MLAVRLQQILTRERGDPPVPVHYIDAITARYEKLGYEPYRWVHTEEAPALSPMTKPLNQARVGVLTTSGAYALGQTAFHYKDDASVRAIPKTTPKEDLRFSHITENYLEGPRRDPDCILPLTALKSLEYEGFVGEVANEALSCMGGIYSQRRVRDELIPDLAARFEAQSVDAVFLVPM